jgi:hypothetical protein
MNDEDILIKALKKALDNGCPLPPNGKLKYKGDGIMELVNDAGLLNLSIFNKDFAKSLWGEEMIEFEEVAASGWDGNDENGEPMFDDYNETLWKPAWETHLMKMVTSKDPIKYLGDHIA